MLLSPFGEFFISVVVLFNSNFSTWFSLSFFFLMWTIFKVFIESDAVLLLLFYVLVFLPQGLWDLSSLIKDQTHQRTLNYWTARETSVFIFKPEF